MVNIPDFLKKVGSFFSKTPPATPEPSRTPAQNAKAGEPYNPLYSTVLTSSPYVDQFYTWMTRDPARGKEMDFYDRLEREIPEVEKALNAFATMATTGTLSGLNRGTFSIRLQDGAPEDLKKRMAKVQGIIRKHAYSIARGMSQYGSYPAWLVMGDPASADYGIRDIEHLPPGTMLRNLTSTDTQQNDYWLQVINGKIESKLSRWQTPHFALWAKVVNSRETLCYGRSILFTAGRRGIQMNAIEDSMVVGRLTRAIQRMCFGIDCGDLRSDPDRDSKIFNRLKRWKDALCRTRSIISDDSANSYEKPPIPDENFFYPTGDGIDFKIEAIQSDANLTSIDDVKYQKEGFAGALGVPLEYLGHAGNRGGRSVLSQVDVNFARSARYIQLYMAGTIESIVNVEMIAGGYDPAKYPVEIVPPTIGARDDLLQAQVRMLQSQVIKNLADAGFDTKVDPKWVLMNLLNMDDELSALPDAVIAKMFKDPPAVTIAATKQATGASAGASSEALLAAAAQNVEGYLDNIKILLAIAETVDSAELPVIASHGQPNFEDLKSTLEAIKHVRAITGAAA